MRRDGLATAATVGVGLLLLALGLVGLNDPVPAAERLPGWPSPWWHVVPLTVGGAAMVGKRRHPLAALVVGSLALGADVAIGGSFSVFLVWFDLLYTVGLRSPARTRRAVTVVVVSAATALAVAAGVQQRDLTAFVLAGLQGVGFVVVPLWWAAGVRHGHELAAAAEERARLEAERADALARAASLDRADAVREERAAMARDLHDVISSHLSAIAIHTTAALSAPVDVDRDRAALTQARATSVTALEEMRTMIDLLRSDSRPEALATGGGLAALPTLVGWARDHGLEVALRAPGRADAALPASVEQSVLRIVQEALTNALKHGTGRAEVAVDVTDRALHLEVRNPCRVPTRLAVGARASSTGDVDDAAGDGGDRRRGAGLTSMRERAEALGGTFDAAPDGGTWVVRATLPVTRVASS